MKNWLSILILLIVVVAAYYMVQSVRQTTQQAVAPLTQANSALQTQVADLLHPTPTIIPDPITIIHEVRALARLETIQYTIEQVITAEQNQGTLGFLFGDRLLFVAHGSVIAGIDMSKIAPEHMQLQNGTLYVTLPPAEVFIVALDNQKSYVYDRETGLFTKGNINLEAEARQAAEQKILQAALDDGILNVAQTNAEAFLTKFFDSLGFKQTVFLRSR
jgi:hypothetical protein